MLPFRARADQGAMAIKGSYPEHALRGESYPFAELQSVYSAAPADWAITSRHKIT